MPSRHMLLQRTGPRVGATARVATVQFLSRVGALVPPQITFISEALEAELAHVARGEDLVGVAGVAERSVSGRIRAKMCSRGGLEIVILFHYQVATIHTQHL